LWPVAITGVFGPEIPFATDDATSLTYGIAVEYSLRYLQNIVRDVGPPPFVSQLSPIRGGALRDPDRGRGEVEDDRHGEYGTHVGGQVRRGWCGGHHPHQQPHREGHRRPSPPAFLPRRSLADRLPSSLPVGGAEGCSHG